MSRLGNAARKLIGVTPQLNPADVFSVAELDQAIEAARARVATAQADADRAAGEQSASDRALGEAEAGISLGDEPAVDRLLEAQRAADRVAIIVKHSTGVLKAAQVALDAVQKERDAAELTWLEQRDATFGERLAAQVVPRLDEICSLASELDRLVSREVATASTEIRRRFELQERLGKSSPERHVFAMALGYRRTMHHQMMRGRVGAEQALRWLEGV